MPATLLRRICGSCGGALSEETTNRRTSTFWLETYLGGLVGRLRDQELVVMLQHGLQVIQNSLAGHWEGKMATVTR